MDDETKEAMRAAVREEMRAILREERPQAAPARTLLRVEFERWASAHARLKSFKCDHARGERVFGLKPFVVGEEEVFWRPSEGPFAGLTLGERDPMSITGEDIDAFRVWRYATTTRRKGPPATATVNREVMMLQRVLNHSASRDRIPRNPVRGIDAEDEDNARAVVIEEEGFDLILRAFAEDALVMRAFVTIGYDSGMRKTELLCCQRSWLDKRRGRISIPAAVAKNGEARVTDLTPRAAAAAEALPRVIGTNLIFANPETTAEGRQRDLAELAERRKDPHRAPAAPVIATPAALRKS